MRVIEQRLVIDDELTDDDPGDDGPTTHYRTADHGCADSRNATLACVASPSGLT